MSLSEDLRFKRHFDSLREEDQRTAPSFWKTVSSARKRASAIERPSRRRIAFAMLLLLLAVLGATQMFWPRRSRAPLPSRSIALASWSSPTAFLLDTPGKRFLNETPQFKPLLYSPPNLRQDTK